MSDAVVSILDRIPQLANTALGFVKLENERSLERARIRAGENVQLAQLGFTTGGARLDPRVVQAGYLPSGAGAGLGAIGPYVPLALGGLLLVMLAKALTR